MAKPQKSDGKESSTPVRANTKVDLPPNECSKVPSMKTITVLEPETRRRRRTSGPRTATGKHRSSLKCADARDFC